MREHPVNILDLPNEILLLILRKLSNVDILYSLLDTDNGRFDTLAQEKSFSDILDFEFVDNVSLITRFTTDILPRIRYNVQCFILQSMFVERILLSSIYPNLTEIKLISFDQRVVLKYFTDKSPLRPIFQEQITKLTLVHHEKSYNLNSLQDYTRTVYAHILKVFENLTHLNITESLSALYPVLTLRNLPSTTFQSSILTDLYIEVETFNDCLRLLDGRLNQLTTLSVTVYDMDESLTIAHNTDMPLHLKYFSLKSKSRFQQLDKVSSLLRRMINLESLILYLRIKDQIRIVDGTLVQNDILIYMPRLQSFTFYISTDADPDTLSSKLSHEDIQKTWIDIGRRDVASMMSYVYSFRVAYSTFSLPFTFDYLVDVGNMFPDIIFGHVTSLEVSDSKAFRYEFFVRIARSFPLLKRLCINNVLSPIIGDHYASLFSGHISSDSMIKYPHLTTLDVCGCSNYYLEQFLNERKAYVPALAVLKVNCRDLEYVTNNFRRNATRRNCAKVKQIIFSLPWEKLHDHLHYFPSLQL